MSIKNLVIVESPAKAKTIEKYLGEGFIVKSSMGHIRDLSSGDGAIDVKNGFAPRYEVPDEKKKLVASHSIRRCSCSPQTPLFLLPPDAFKSSTY